MLLPSRPPDCHGTGLRASAAGSRFLPVLVGDLSSVSPADLMGRGGRGQPEPAQACLATGAGACASAASLPRPAASVPLPALRPVLRPAPQVRVPPGPCIQVGRSGTCTRGPVGQSQNSVRPACPGKARSSLCGGHGHDELARRAPFHCKPYAVSSRCAQYWPDGRLRRREPRNQRVGLVASTRQSRSPPSGAPEE